MNIPPSLDFFTFISHHAHEDISKLMLKFSGKVDFDLRFAIDQIQARQKNKKKFPSLHNNDRILFPPDLNLQQSSSEETAEFKAQIMGKKTVVDLTGGFGIDTMAFAKNSEKAVHVEPNSALQELVKYNAKVLQIKLDFFNMSAEDYLNKISPDHQCCYIDPSRRQNEKRVFNLEDYAPNVLELMPVLKTCFEQILIKTSPFLDINLTLSKLHDVKEVFIISVKNEVKEVLYHIVPGIETPSPIIRCFNLSTGQKEFQILHKRINEFESKTGPLQRYLYIPNASILKSGAFAAISDIFNLSKLHLNTHIYTSEKIIEFPGKIFEVQKQLDFNTPGTKKELKNASFNIILRNYPMDVFELKKKYGINEGGNNFLIGCTNSKNKPIILIAKQVF